MRNENRQRKLPVIEGLPEPLPHWVGHRRDAADDIITLPEDVYIVPVDADDLEAQIVERREICARTERLVGMAVMLDLRSPGDEDWLPAYRVDTSREFVHEHFYPPLVDEDQHHVVENVPDNCRESLEAALDWAVETAQSLVWAL